MVSQKRTEHYEQVKRLTKKSASEMTPITRRDDLEGAQGVREGLGEEGGGGGGVGGWVIDHLQP